jgi:hypothetical protein
MVKKEKATTMYGKNRMATTEGDDGIYENSQGEFKV